MEPFKTAEEKVTFETRPVLTMGETAAVATTGRGIMTAPALRARTATRRGIAFAAELRLMRSTALSSRDSRFAARRPFAVGVALR
jgi:hypothetical protein